ncbi:MAG: 3'(2'),5'-bisphosphate nucleotidase CysQ [Chitinophagaceae bacterium]|nr:3'(2'),5'-bisphosphate nucleotidase CysQ [Flavobacteriaceae bacterium]
MIEIENLLLAAVNTSIKAGNAIMDIYHKDFAVEFKQDASPLTEADKLADEIIQLQLTKTYPVLSEEKLNTEFTQRKNWELFWMVDPLDGTKEFINKNGEFTVNIALIKKGIPILGVVYAPAIGTLYFGSSETGSYKFNSKDEINFVSLTQLMNLSEKLDTKKMPSVYTIVASRSHLTKETAQFVEQSRKEHGELKLISKGSSIKICLVAEGKANTYPRLAPTMEWDTAAAHAVAKFAGCKVVNFATGEELIYNKENLKNPHFIVSR